MQNVLEEVFDLKLQVKDMKLTLEEIMAKLNFLIDEIQDRERKHKREIIEMRKTHDRWMDDMVQEFDDFKNSFATKPDYVEEKKKEIKGWTRPKPAEEPISVRRLKTEASRSLSPPMAPPQRRSSPPRRSPPPRRAPTPPRRAPTPPRRSPTPSSPPPSFTGHPKTDVSKLRCYRCHDLGHMARNCTNKAILCYKCKKFEGHVAENCPYGEDARGSSPEMGGGYGNNEHVGKFDDYERFDGRRGGGPRNGPRYAPYRSNGPYGRRSRFDDA